MTFDSATYWRARGEGYERNFRPERYVAQELELEELLRPLTFASVLDVGCGFGRIGEMVARLRPGVRYVGVDVSKHQLAAAKRRVPTGEFHVGDVRRMGNEGDFDLVLAIEVLMHQPPAEVGGVVESLKRLARRHLVTLDWSRPIGRTVKAPDFLHDYRALLGPEAAETRVGAQSIWYLAR